MIKVFLSHSSKDKPHYVEQVVANLKKNNIVYDELTFEPGLRSIDEIFTGIDKSSLFVVFLSANSIESEWVKKELVYAKEKLEQNYIEQIYPILIDTQVRYSDSRIPNWMKEEYNLRIIARPAIAAKKIQQRLRELSWKKHPIIKERKKIFVGRNEIIQTIEERMDDFDSPTPPILNTSGLPRIGRSSVLINAIEKCNIVDSSYECPHIFMGSDESIEDLIVKLYDLGLSEKLDIYNLMAVSYESKLDICYKLIDAAQKIGEIILIHDDGCLIDYKGEIPSWFDDLCNKMKERNQLYWIVASTKRIFPRAARKKPYIFSINIPELSIAERKGLFRRALNVYGIDLDNERVSAFSDLLTGFPDQVFYACEQISDLGVVGAWRKSHEITSFNSERASIILLNYEKNQDILDFIFLLSKFEFISINFLFSIEGREEFQEVLSELIIKSICDYVGSDKEFVRLNDSIRDYIDRNRLGIPQRYAKKLDDHLKKFLEKPENYQDDLSDILYSIKEAIKIGKVVPEKYLIPSHFLKSIRELYHQKKQLNKVIELSDKILQKAKSLDSNIVQNIRYYLCLALARKRDKRFLSAVQQIQGPEHNFLLGFYYRLTNRPKDAIERFSKCLEDRVIENRSKRELVQVLLSIRDYEAAFNLAKDNYEDYPANQYHIQAYLITLIHSKSQEMDFQLIESLIEELNSLGTEVSKEMSEIAEAEYIANCKNDYSTARYKIMDTVSKYPNSDYPSLSQAFLAVKHRDQEMLIDSYKRLKEASKKRHISKATLDQLNASNMALHGDINKAIRYAKSNLHIYPDIALQKIIQDLRIIASNTGINSDH